MRFFVCILLFSFSFFVKAQEVLKYKEVIDYYREQVISTVLTLDCKFLKDGNYTFKGDIKDFDFLLNNYLQIDTENSNFFKPNDSLVYSGSIKDSVKVGIWRLELLREGKKQDFIYNTDRIKKDFDFREQGSDGCSNCLRSTYIFPKDFRTNFYTSSHLKGSLKYTNVIIKNIDPQQKNLYYVEENGFKISEGKIETYLGLEIDYDGISVYGALNNIIKTDDNNIGGYSNTFLVSKRDDNPQIDGRSISLTILEKIKNYKLIQLIVEDDEIKKNPYFSKILGNNYFPAILYQRTKYWIR